MLDRARLTEAKEIAGHGNWLPWRKREFGWKERNARNFIQVFQMIADWPLVTE